MDKMKFETPNLTAENVAKIAELFPGVVTEGKVNIDLLRSMLGEDVYGDEAYEFTWVGKRAAIAEAGRPIRKTLRPCVEESKNWDTTENLYIEGDNLDVLKLLQESYLGKVKMIYIDPPYNTGGDSFIYIDDYAMDDEEYDAGIEFLDENGNKNLRQNPKSNPRFHSGWCSMIYSRLVLARNLLSSDGVVFISIDDNEVENLKKMCDEVFGADSFIESVVWKSKYGAGAKTTGFISAHEYILCYGKYPVSNVTCDFEGVEREKYSKKDEKYDIRGPYRTQPLMTNSLADRPNLMYPIEYNGTQIVPRKQWVWSKERMMKAIENNDVEFSLQSDGTYSVRSKSYLYDEDGTVRRGKPVSVLNGPFTQDGTKEIRTLFDDRIIFDFSKPSKLIEFFLKLEINDKNDKDFIVLDFFSGSSTTAHAVMQLNAEDGGNRKFIMVQLPEVSAEGTEAAKAGYKNICEIGKERIRRAGDKIKAEAGLTAQNLDIGFRVLKLDDTNMNDVYYAAGDYTQDLILQMESNIKPDRTDLDLLYGCLLDWGLPLSMPHTHEKIDGFTIHTYNDGDLIACFEERISEKAIREIASRKPLRAVFRDSSFNSSPEKINVFEIFKLLAPNTNVRVI